jgi:hypothetical protein
MLETAFFYFALIVHFQKKYTILPLHYKEENPSL